MATYYWVLGSGDWNSTNTANWSTSSGGSGGAGPPVSGDDVVFDAGSDSGAGFTVTVVATGPTIRNLTISGLDQAMILAGTPAWTIQGSISLPASNFTWSASGTVTLSGAASSRTILTNGVTINGGFTFNSAGSDWTLQSALTMGGNDSVTLTAGDLDLAGYAVSCQSFLITGTSTRALTMGAATVSVSNSGNAWSAGTTTNLTFDAGTSNIIMTRNANAKTFVGGGLTYYNVSQGGSGPLTISGANTFNDIQNPYKTTGATSILFTAGVTQTVSAFTASGEAGRVLTIESTVAASAATLSKASGTVDLDYLSLQDSTATGGASFYAGNNSTDVSGNTGWTFTNAPRTAAAAITEASDTVSSASRLALKAAASLTEASDSLSSAGNLPINGTLAKTEASDNLSSAGVLPIVATAAIGEAGDSLVSAARLALIAAAAITEADDSLSAFGCDPIEADLSVTEADDTLTADSWVRWPIAAALAVTEAGDVAAAASSSRTWQQVAVNSESWTRVSR
jgi:hypothetical protein